MFRNVIDMTSLTAPFAEEYFREKIFGDSVMRDKTFISTLRALATPRMKEDDRIVFKYLSDTLSSRTFATGSDYDLKELLCVNPEKDCFTVINFACGIQTSIEKAMKAVEGNMESKGWHRLSKVTDFYRKVFKVLCYINADCKSVAIYTDNMDIRKMHYLQCGIFAFLPWYFDPKDGVTELEMELINSLREKTPEKYEECIEKIASQYDFRTAGIKSMLSGFELKYERVKKAEVERQIESILKNIDGYNREIRNLLREKRDQDLILLGIDAKLASDDGDSEIMQYFLKNRKLSLISVTDSDMEFVVNDYLEYFDEDMASNAIDNLRSYIYRPNGQESRSISPADMKTLMEAVFVDQVIKIKFCAAYRFDLNGYARGISNYEYGSEFRDCMPNTHIDRFSCLGNYERQINIFLRNHDYIGAIEQCVASCKSLNFGDSMVMNEFIRRIYGTSDYQKNNRCFELPDGSVVKPKEAIEYLKKQNGEDAENG